MSVSTVIDPRLPTKGNLTIVAMVIWENVLERIGGTGDSGDQQAAATIVEAEGACTARELFADMAAPMDQAWSIATSLGYDDPFDWDFVPAILDQILPAMAKYPIALPTGEEWKGALAVVLECDMEALNRAVEELCE